MNYCPCCGHNLKNYRTDEVDQPLKDGPYPSKSQVIKKSEWQNTQACLWDQMPETFPGSGIKIGGLVCPCPKCRIVSM